MEESLSFCHSLQESSLKETTLFHPFLPPLVHGRKWEKEKHRSSWKMMPSSPLVQMKPGMALTVLQPTYAFWIPAKSCSPPAPFLKAGSTPSRPPSFRLSGKEGYHPGKVRFLYPSLSGRTGRYKKKYKYLMHWLKQFESLFPELCHGSIHAHCQSPARRRTSGLLPPVPRFSSLSPCRRTAAAPLPGRGFPAPPPFPKKSPREFHQGKQEKIP